MQRPAKPNIEISRSRSSNPGIVHPNDTIHAKRNDTIRPFVRPTATAKADTKLCTRQTLRRLCAHERGKRVWRSCARVGAGLLGCKESKASARFGDEVALGWGVDRVGPPVAAACGSTREMSTCRGESAPRDTRGARTSCTDDISIGFSCTAQCSAAGNPRI